MLKNLRVQDKSFLKKLKKICWFKVDTRYKDKNQLLLGVRWN